MPVCSICTHPERTEIDKALVEGASCRDVAGRWGVSKSAVDRHGIHIARAVERHERKAAQSALDHSTWLVGKLRKLAEETVDTVPRQFLEVADRLEKAIRTHGIVTGEIKRGEIQINVTNEISQRLGVPEPEAKLAVGRWREASTMGDEQLAEVSASFLRGYLERNPDQRFTILEAVGFRQEQAVAPALATNGVPYAPHQHPPGEIVDPGASLEVDDVLP